MLCVPKASHNLISVAKFCQQNNVYIEFHPFSFSVKDLKTGATLMCGPTSGDLYTLQPSLHTPPINLHASRSTNTLWHARLGHPSTKTLHQALKTFLPSSSRIFSTTCNSCFLNKSHKLPFHESSIKYFYSIWINFFWCLGSLSNNLCQFHLSTIHPRAHRTSRA